jgi:hypothetical protein
MPLGPGVTNRLANADILLEPFKELNLIGIFNGHFHAFTQKKLLSDVLTTTNVCCSHKAANHDGTFQKGFFLIEAANASFRRTFVEFGTDFPGSAHPNAARPATPPANVPASQPGW